LPHPEQLFFLLWIKPYAPKTAFFTTPHHGVYYIKAKHYQSCDGSILFLTGKEGNYQVVMKAVELNMVSRCPFYHGSALG
jgi:hypothetical protein